MSLRQCVIQRCQQVRLAHPEAAVEIQSGAGQHGRLAQQPLLAGTSLARDLDELAARGQRRGLRRLRRVRVVVVEAHLGERWRRHQLRDQPLRRHARMPIDQVLHGRTVRRVAIVPVPDDAVTRFTRLDSLTTVDTADLPRLYDYPRELTRCWVRANMIVSVDGGATLDGRAGGLAGRGDRALFKVLRDVADVVLVGAGTVRTENYSGAQLSVAARQNRQARGQAEVPPIAVVTA